MAKTNKKVKSPWPQPEEIWWEPPKGVYHYRASVPGRESQIEKENLIPIGEPTMILREDDFWENVIQNSPKAAKVYCAAYDNQVFALDLDEVVRQYIPTQYFDIKE